MGTRTSYTPGTPSWVDLTTPDQDAAKRFYSEVFGWGYDDNPVGEDMVYSMATVDGSQVGAVSPQPQQQREAGAPPMWNTYITVESADESLRRAEQLGAKVHAPAFDVMEAGRMGIVQDPQGAFFAAWEPRQHPGAGLVNAPGAFSWSELVSPDPEGSKSFYAEMFGWTSTAFEGMQMNYATLQNSEGHTIGGVRDPMGGEPPYWLVYFGCQDVGRTLGRAVEAGAGKIADAADIGGGMTIGVLSDPQGAVFALYSGRFED